MRQPGQIDWRYKQALDAAGISQRALGQITGINHTLLSMYAKGRYVLDSIERHKISKALKMQESEIFTDWESECWEETRNAS
jgi:transcriptional regulator with XRE-family HTH domain